MPPIPLHKNDPILPAAAKPDGVTPQTADSNPPPTRTTPASVPASRTADPNSPPAPQPGARPILPTASAQGPSSSTPPLPQPGGYSATHVTTETSRAGPPPQFNLPPPSDAQLAGRSTISSTKLSKPGPTTLTMGSAAAPSPGASPFQNEHRGGAVQELPRSSLEGPPGYVQADNTPYTPASGRREGSAEQDGVGGAAWSMLARAGEALKKGEEAAWRAVRNK